MPAPTDPSPDESTEACGARCPPGSAEELNRGCFCVGVDRARLHGELDAALRAHGVSAALAESHPTLFSDLSVHVSRRHVDQVMRIVHAIEAAVALPVYQEAALRRAPDIARFDPGSPGGVLGFDFHLGMDGPRLIEINTNPGGALLNVLLAQAQRACLPLRTEPPTDVSGAEAAVVQALLDEWNAQRGPGRPGLVAIVDEAPREQYLYPEFVLFRQSLRQLGLRAEIAAPEQLDWRDGKLRLAGEAIDLVYNRLTDFALDRPGHAALRAAYLADAVVLTPHPRAHALYADKRNLALLGDGDFLNSLALDPGTIAVLEQAVPPTQLLTADSRDRLWAARNRLFFKPATGFGSKASYRGDKLTRRVWEEMAGGIYVAQQVVPPSERHLALDADPMKVDVRCYAYRGTALLFAARLYQGQATNFRTRGGGFAPVLTESRRDRAV